VAELATAQVAYDGPRARIATLTGSPVWGLGDTFPEVARRHGFELLQALRPATPYGVGPRLEHYRSPSGRDVLRIPSYGMVRGEDWSLRAAEWKVFWLLWQAGVEVVVIGGTSGSCDWRADETAVQPGDLVLPWSYISFDAVPSGLPGTPLESTLAERVPLMDEPFCPSLATSLSQAAAQAGSPFRRIHPQAEHVILHRWQYGAFESAAYSLLLRELGRALGSAVITGDCVSPVLARVCGMHLLYYHVASNWAEGLRPQHLTASLDRFYLETLPGAIAALELGLLDHLDVPVDCRCRELLRDRPPAYAAALTPPLPPDKVQ
jgi:purine nucleoside phosphorylase